MYKVMVVDDERFVRKSIINRIDWKTLNLEVTAEADNGEDAYHLALEFKPEIMLVDIRMPLMTGIELIQLVKEKLPETKFIILSGYDDFEYTKKAIKLGVSNYIKKPIDEIELTETLQNIIKNLSEKRRLQKDLLLLSNQAEQDLKELYSKSLNKLLHGYISSLPADIELKGPDYGIILIFHNKSGSTQDSKSMVCDVVSKNLAPLQSCITRIHIFYDDKYTGVLCILLDANHLTPASMSSLAVNLKDSILNPASIDYVPGASAISYCLSSKEVPDIRSLYSRALGFLKHKLLLDNVKILSENTVPCSSLNNYNKNFFECAHKAVFHIEQSIGDKNFTGARKILSNIFNSLNKEKLSIGLIEALTREVGTILKKLAVLYSVESASELLDDLFEPDYMLRFKNIDELKEDITTRIYSLFFSGPDLSEDNIIERIKQYIDIHYSEDITVNHLAKDFFINANYLSQLFKNKTGVNLSKYIEDIRIEKSMTLLSNFQIKIRDIAISVGYSDPNYFTKVFKKHTQMTPAEYQQKFAGGNLN